MSNTWGAGPKAGPRVIASCLLAFAAASANADDATFDQVRASYRGSETVLLDRHGEPVQAVRTDPAARRGAWVPLAQISPALRAATIAAEDRQFETHGGVDWSAVAGAAIGRAQPGGTRGASTITMQLAGLVDTELAATRGGRSIFAKIGQAAAALRIERRWTKDQILEAYLNLVPFRGELVGVGAMSQSLFGKAPSGLNAEESAIAAALLRAPNAAPALVGRRACGILQAQGRGEACATAQGFAELILARSPAATLEPAAQLAPHFARQVMAAYGSSNSGLAAGGAAPRAASDRRPPAPATLRTTLDAATQLLARDALQGQLSELRGRNVEDGAVVVLDNASGDVLAWVGSSGEFSAAPEVDAVLARRQPGSTLKPFLYEQAIEERWLTAASILDDTPARLHTPSGLYIPQNYDHDFKGPVSVRTALGSSLNVPAVRTLVLVSPERFARRLDGLGLALAKPGDFYGYGLALGAAEVNLLGLTNAYRALANGGMAGAPRMEMAVKAAAPARAMDAAGSYIVADILSDNGARVPTFGLDNALATRYWSAVKTGTSKDMRDNWCIGFDARFTVGVWVGNASGEPMHAVSGVTGAAPVWRKVMDALHAHSPVAAPLVGARPMPVVDTRGAVVRGAPRVVHATSPSAHPPPPGLVHQRVAFASDLEATRLEWFIEGTQTGHVELASAAGSAGRLIASPDDRSVIALDPDIPPAVQRLRFEAVAPLPPGAAWRLDGRRLGLGRPLAWQPWPGHHRLELVASGGRVLDEVSFDVRGAQVAAAAASAAALSGQRIASGR
jgi:penicillin-binding protein 1C